MIIAAKVLEGFESQGWQILGSGGSWAKALHPLEAYIKDRVERAVKAEREACAKLCEEQAKSLAPTSIEKYRASVLAATIRARGQPAPCPDCHGIGYDASGQLCACQQNPSF